MRIAPVRLLLAVVALVVLVALGLALAAWWLITPERIRTTLEQQATAAVGEPVAIGALSVGWYPRVALQLQDVRIGAPVQARAGEIDVSTGLGGLLSRRVEDAEITVRKSRIDLPKLLAVVARLSNAPARGTPESGASFAVASVRAIALDDVVLVAGAEAVQASARGTLEGQQLRIDRLSATGPGTQLSASGTIALPSAGAAGGASPLEVTLTTTADKVDVDRLLAFVSGAFPEEQPKEAAARTTRVTMDVQAKSGTVAGIAFSDLATHVVLAGSRLTLDPFRTGIFGGQIDARLTRTASPARLEVTGSLTGAETARVLSWLHQPTDAITGRLSAKVQLTGAGDDLAAPSAWRGTARATMTGGTLKGLSMVRSTVISFAGRGERAAPSGADDYERIDGVFALEGFVIRCRELKLDSRDLDLQGEGTVAAASGALDLRVQLLLSPELSAQAGRDLYRYAHEGDRIVLPAVIRGQLGAPSISIDAAQAATRAIRNKVEEEAGSLLDRLLKKRKKP